MVQIQGPDRSAAERERKRVALRCDVPMEVPAARSPLAPDEKSPDESEVKPQSWQFAELGAHGSIDG
ncbi:uncharacterized protein BCR38DRAFT_481921 [Pseudomassariella vexata]|uniref:Uncharacterized protein n=1 Tax=Pseudomassariella vexata TaxID=1141098 RepID=A0A1Y2EA62_9PEZI|nr:uncharacterized protein BCR38DRAFT_481921 [Pseudomassariella vexata]ORY68432.1 hypothetical protein BCR38DRAFT_481921 [Pseudomassariella vexata]